MNKRTDIFIVSYSKDIGWLEYNLRSIKKFCTGFGPTHVLVPTNELDLFKPLQERFGFILQHYETPAETVKHHIAHQLQKCRADEWCPHADTICFSDSDCIWTEPVTPNDYFVDGKPVLLVRPYSESGGGQQWKPTVDRALGMDSYWETMARHPAVHYREIFTEVRAMVSRHNKMPFDDYVLSCKPDFPWGFSEFNVIGNYAMWSHWRDKYHAINLEVEDRPRDKLLQAWSHSPPELEQTLPSLGAKVVPKTIFDKVLA